MPTALALLTNLDLERNQLLRAALELVAAPDATPVTGQLAFTDGTITALPKWSVIIRDGETPTPGWRVLGAINKAHTVTGFWTFKPDFTAAGAPAAAGDPPFGVDPLRFGRVPNLTADMVDSWHASSPVPDGSAAPPGSFLPVYDTFGRLAVADPVNPYNVVNLQTLQAASQGISPRDPCQYATTANLSGGRSGNVLTGSPVGVLAVDGLNPVVGERVLVKNQTLPADNGIYSVTNAGAVGSAWILTRASDADATAEVRVGTTTYIEKGNTNLSTQWQCSAAGTLNTDPNLWVKSFQQSAYLAGKGMVLSGLTFHFGTSSNYTVNALWYNSSTSALSQLAPPASLKFLQSPSGGPPAWADVAWADIAGKPTLPTAPGAGGTAGYHTRWAASNALVDSNLLDSSTAVVGAGNSLAAATISLGNDTAPFAGIWTNELRLKTSAGAGPIGALYGLQNSTNDPNLNHRKVVTWGVSELKSWLVYSPADIGAVPTDRTLTINGVAGQINVATQAAWDLSANRTWTLSLDLDTLDTHWVTLHTDQSLSGRKSWYSATSSASESKIRVGVGVATEPTWSVRAGGVVSWGDGIAPAAATIDFANDRLRFDGKPVQFATAAVIRATSALSSQGTPVNLLGLTVNDDVQRVTPTEITAFIGSPALTAAAVGYGGSDNRLTGNASLFRWDAVNVRLGLNQNAPAATLDMVGSLKLTQVIASLASGNAATYPGTQLVLSDIATASADWTNRTMIGQSTSIAKTGTATFVTAGTIEGERTVVTVTGGSVSGLYGYRLNVAVGNAGAGATAGTVYGFFSQPAGGSGAVGTITALYQFSANDIVAPSPQPVTHYGFRCANLASASGATRTAGLALELASAGTGERFNLYAPGTAPSYFAGNLGLGVTTPTARLELAVGTTTLAPFRFAATSSALLTTPLAGMVESRGDHLTFTDAASPAARHILAHLDDLNFTNDASAARSGAIIFGPTDNAAASLTAAGFTEAIGTGDFTLFSRFFVSPGFRGPANDGIIGLGLTASTVTNFGAVMWLGSTGSLAFVLYGNGATSYRQVMFLNFRQTYAGKIVDLVAVRSGGSQPVVYVDGVALTGGSESVGTTPPAWADAVNSQYLLTGNCHTTTGSVSRIYRAVLFNRALTASEVLDLSRNGIAPGDRWGSGAVVKSYNFATDAALSSNDAANMSVLVNQTVNGSPGWLTATRLNSTGRMDLNMSTTGYWKFGMRLGAKIRVYVSGVTPNHFGLSFGGSVVESSLKVAVTAGVETVVSPTAGNGASSVVNTVLRVEPGTSSATTAAVGTFDAGTTYAIKTVDISVVGAIVDLDLGVGCGTAIPDRSGRYHGTLSGTTWSHYIGTCPTELPSGSGTVSRGLRRYTQTITAKDNDLVTITHGLGTSNLVIAVWNAAGETVQVAARRKTGSETTAIEIGFGLVASPVTPISFLVLIVG